MAIRKWRVLDWQAELRRWLAWDRARKEEESARERKVTSRELSARLTRQRTGRWFCIPCDCWHGSGECPKQFDRRVESIERAIARAIGWSDEYYDKVIADIAFDINWRGDSRMRNRYIMHPDVGPYIRLLEETPLVGIGHNGPESLSDEQKKLIHNHYPLVLSIAGKYARNSPAWRDDLVTRLLEKLTELIHQYDKTRGVTFGAFARLHLMGEARDYIRNNARMVAIEPDKIDIVVRNKTRKLPKQSTEKYRPKHWSAGDKRLDQITDGKSSLWLKDREHYASAYWNRKELERATAEFRAHGGEIKRNTPNLTDELEAAIAKLNARQQAVYRGMVMKEPPDSRFKLALQLGIRDVTQISRIKRQAERKMARLLRRKVSPPDGI